MLLFCFKTHYGAKFRAAGYQDQIFISKVCRGRMPFWITLALWSDHYSSVNSHASCFSFNESQTGCPLLQSSLLLLLYWFVPLLNSWNFEAWASFLTPPSLWACSCYSGCITLLRAPVFPAHTNQSSSVMFQDALSWQFLLFPAECYSTAVFLFFPPFQVQTVTEIPFQSTEVTSYL